MLTDRKFDKLDLLPPGNLRDQIVAIAILGLLFFLILQPEYLVATTSRAGLGITTSLLLLVTIPKRRIYLPLQVIVPFTIFLIVVVLTTFTSQVPEESLKDLVFYASLMAAFLLVFQLTIRQKEFILWFAETFFLLGFLLVAIFFIEELPQLFAGKQFVGPFYWYNQMAAFLLFLLPLSFAALLFQKGWRLMLWLMINIFLLVSFALTYSRASWISFALSLLPLLLFMRKPFLTKRRQFLILFLGFLVVFLILLQFSPISSRLESILQEFTQKTRSTSGNLRLSVYTTAIKIFRDFPIVGVGPGVFGQAFYAYQREPWLYAKHTHNHFLQVAAEMGIMGLVPFLAIFVGIFVIGQRFGDKVVEKALGGEKLPLLLLAFAISLLASFLHNLFDVDWNWTSLGFLFWLMAGIFVAGLYPSEKETFFLNSSLGRRVILFPLFLLLLLSIFLFYLEKKNQLGKKAFFEQKYEISTQTFAHIPKVPPFSYTASLYLGHLLQKNGKFDQAFASYSRTLALNPFSAEPLYNQGLLLLGQKKEEEAEVKFRQAIEKNPFSAPEYYTSLAKIRLGNQDFDGAEEVLKKAVVFAFPINESFKDFSFIYNFTGFNKKLAETYLLYAQVLLMKQKNKESLEVVNQALKYLDQENSELRLLQSFLQTK